MRFELPNEPTTRLREQPPLNPEPLRSHDDDTDALVLAALARVAKASAARHGRRARPRRGMPMITDGPFAESKEMLGWSGRRTRSALSE